jgi:hypothetical protein
MAEQDDKNEALFFNLVLMFQMAAWQHLGKIKNPMTDKIDRNLDQARFSIDILEMIRKKTAGNLSDAEKRMLDHTVRELQLNYVDEAEKDQKASAAPPDAPIGEKDARESKKGAPPGPEGEAEKTDPDLTQL